MTDWQPVVVALAALVVAVTPSIVGLVVGLASHGRLRRVERSTNGNLSALRAEVASLRLQLDHARSGGSFIASTGPDDMGQKPSTGPDEAPGGAIDPPPSVLGLREAKGP